MPNRAPDQPETCAGALVSAGLDTPLRGYSTSMGVPLRGSSISTGVPLRGAWISMLSSPGDPRGGASC
ncbi:hypothetical protein [Rathayibacter sp. PhB152]|uniref:hypothetical protein n=1 Tax=Rathayibacter sp. PhB152 TaxID=2485190 RepID=UPI0011CEAC96|nr:hypothetical protein [Rathayibacter sp. PhB152]